MLSLVEVYLKRIKFNVIRELVILHKNIELQNNLNINSRFNRSEKLLSVILELEGKGITSNNVEAITFSISVEGTFSLDNEIGELSDDVMELLSKVKAPQLLFPFVIETIYNLSAKSGIKPISLPYIDFEKLYFENKKFSDNNKIIN